MLALIDADIVLYRNCWASQNENLDICKFRTDEMIDHILEETKADEFQLWLSDNKEANFRYKLDPTYKSTRPLEKPIHFNEIKEFLITDWNAKFAFGMEADDALGIEQTKANTKMNGWVNTDNSIICTIDKDLQQVPGNHYNFVKKEFKFVTPEEGLRFFYSQLLIGDTSDNIQGCRGIGPKKTAKILGGLQGEQDLFYAVVNTYCAQHNEWNECQVLSHIAKIGPLLKIRQTEDEPLWQSPKNSLEAFDSYKEELRESMTGVTSIMLGV